MPAVQARYWMLTIPADEHWMPHLSGKLVWVKGQLEEGANGYRHWQVVCSFSSKVTMSAAKLLFPVRSHLEVTRSAAADEYVWKEETRVGNS